MERPSLIQTKVRVSHARNLLSRPRLLGLVRKSLDRKLLLVCAGPGYGKTSLLADFAQQTDLPVCWYTLDASDRDPSTFLDYLVEAVRIHFPGFGEQTRALLEGSSARDIRGVVGLLVNELAALPEEKVVIVLDEYQAVSSEEGINQILALLLEYLPENVHLIVASRTTPPLPHIRLLAYGEVAGIGADELRFSQEEVRAVLGQQDITLPETEVRTLAERSEGWITGILLGTQVIWQYLSGFLSDLSRPADRVYDYMTGEVLSSLPLETRDFLTKASVLHRVQADLCDALLERQDSAEVLEWLEKRNLFLIPMEGGWYRFHGLFRESLLREARADWDEFERLNRRAAALWRERGETHEAVEHLLQAQSYGEAAEEVAALALSLFTRGQYQTLARWIAAIPGEIAQEYPSLLLYQAKVLADTGRIEEALPLLQEARRALEHSDDRANWVRVMAVLSYGLRMWGNHEEAAQVALEAISHVETPVPALVDLQRNVGFCLAAQGDLAGAETYLRAAVQSSLALSDVYDQALAFQDLGLVLMWQGRLAEAEEADRRALHLFREVGSPGPLAAILNNLAMRPFLRGDFFQAKDLLHQALEAVEISLSPHLRAVVRASLSDLHRDERDRYAAWRMAREGLKLARQAQSASLISYLHEALGNLSRGQGALVEAHRYLEEALAAAGSAVSDQVRIWISLALLEVFEGRYGEADNLLEKSLQALGETGEQLQVLRAHLARATCWYYQGRDGAPGLFRQVLDEVQETGIVEPLIAEADLLRPLCRKVDLEEDSPLLRALRSREQARPVAQATLPPGEVAPRLRLLVLGPGRVLKGEEEVPQAAWGGSLPREVFFYLAFNAPQKKEEIGAVFWPDASLSAVTRRLHNMLYRARQAIGENFVAFQDGVYSWVPEMSYWCDADWFRELVNRADELPAGAPGVRVLLEQAAALYRGDFMADFAYSEWCRQPRDELRETCLRVLLRLGRIYARQQDIAGAQRAYQRAAELDSYYEEAYRGLMWCAAALGERNLAVRVYQQCCALLQEELGAEPLEETRELYAAIRRGSPLAIDRLP